MAAKRIFSRLHVPEHIRDISVTLSALEGELKTVGVRSVAARGSEHGPSSSAVSVAVRTMTALGIMYDEEFDIHTAEPEPEAGAGKKNWRGVR